MIECRVCGKKLKHVQWTHLETHDMSVEEYKTKFPSAPLQADELRENPKKRKIAIENSPFKKGCTPWNKGLNKMNDERVKKGTEKCKGKRPGIRGRNNPAKRKDVREKISRGVSDARRKKFWRTNPRRRVQVRCRVCGKEFETYRSRVERTKYCSMKCRGKALSMQVNHDPHLKRKHKKNTPRGETHSNWRNGASFEPYPPEFNSDLKQSIKERDGYMCRLCDEEDDILIHHIDWNKKNNSRLNLITLCRSCHLESHQGKTPLRIIA